MTISSQFSDCVRRAVGLGRWPAGLGAASRGVGGNRKSIHSVITLIVRFVENAFSRWLGVPAWLACWVAGFLNFCLFEMDFDSHIFSISSFCRKVSSVGAAGPGGGPKIPQTLLIRPPAGPLLGIAVPLLLS